MSKRPSSGAPGNGAVRPARHHTTLILLLAGAVIALVFALCTPGKRRGPDGGDRSGPGLVTVTGAIAAGLYPGGSRPVTFTAANPGASAVTVRTVRLVGASATPGCVAADFTMPDVAQDFEVPGGATATALPNPGTFSMGDTTANQDICKGAALTLTLSTTLSSDQITRP